jgi:hypothetical protein
MLQQRDVVKFGETNAAPPSLSATPRRRHNMKVHMALSTVIYILI